MKFNRIILLAFTAILFLTASVWNPVQQVMKIEEYKILLSEVGLEDFTILNGPFDELDFSVKLPAYYQIIGGAELTLNLRSYFSSFIAAQGEEDYRDNIAGSLEIIVNDQKIDAIVMQGEGREQTISISIPEHVLLTNSSGLIEINLFWNGSISCDLNLTTALAIQPESFLAFDVEEIEPEYSLNNFPEPFSSHVSLGATPTYLLIPEPTLIADFEAAAIISTGFGRLTSGQMDIQLLAQSDLTIEKLSEGHIVLLVKNRSLPNPPEEFSSYLNALGDGQGFIGLTNSPYNPNNALLLISANSDEDLVATAKIAASGVFLSDDSGSLAILDNLDAEPVMPAYQPDISLGNFNEKVLVFNKFGPNSIEIPVVIPFGVKVGVDAYFDIHFNHSILMDYLRSGINISLNDHSISSIRLSDNTSENTRLKVILPNNLIKPGENLLRIEVSIHPMSICVNPEENNIWFHLFGDSSLHLPVSEQEFYSDHQISFSNFIEFLNYSSEDAVSYLAISRDNLSALNAALDIAYFIGQKSKGYDQFLKVTFVDDLSPTDINSNSIIAVADTKVLIQSPINEFLLADFPGNGSIEIPGEPILNLIPDKDTSFIQLIEIDHNLPAFMLVVNSQTAEGISQAVDMLFSEKMKTGLKDNLLIIQENEIYPFFIDLADLADLEDSQNIDQSEADAPESSTVTGKPFWLIPLLILTALSLTTLIGYDLSKIVSRFRKWSK